VAPPSRGRRIAVRALVALVVTLAVAAGLDALLTAVNAPPRALASYVQWRMSGHGAALAEVGERIGRVLDRLDRGEPRSARRDLLHVGAQPRASTSYRAEAVRSFIDVASEQEARAAFAAAQAGDVITFAPGTYLLQEPLAATRPGTAAAPIVVRAARPGTVVLEVAEHDGVVVSAPYWAFENLTLRGVCTDHSACEHAFHVVGSGSHFVARNNTLLDFNAHIKINGEVRRYPDDGLVEGNTITNRTARATANTVSGIDLVAASRWIVRGNVISDLVKAQGDRVAYGGYAKGGGTDNRFEGNVVWCEHLLRDLPGWRIGLSLGGGGTGAAYCRDGRCITEQEGGRIESNLVASCSDDGVYVNSGAGSRIAHNTLVDTGGVSVRFTVSSADVEGNLVDGSIRVRDGALVRARDNRDTALGWLYLGRHPERDVFRDAPALDFAWRADAPRRALDDAPGADLCGKPRQPLAAYGAFDDYAACLGTAADAVNPP
jgi:hypothetical protein